MQQPGHGFVVNHAAIKRVHILLGHSRHDLIEQTRTANGGTRLRGPR